MRFSAHAMKKIAYYFTLPAKVFLYSLESNFFFLCGCEIPPAQDFLHLLVPSFQGSPTFKFDAHQGDQFPLVHIKDTYQISTLHFLRPGSEFISSHRIAEGNAGTKYKDDRKDRQDES